MAYAGSGSGRLGRGQLAGNAQVCWRLRLGQRRLGLGDSSSTGDGGREHAKDSEHRKTWETWEGGFSLETLKLRFLMSPEDLGLGLGAREMMPLFRDALHLQRTCVQFPASTQLTTL